MATRKAKCLKRGKHNKCLKRASSKKSRGGGRKRRCRTSKGKFKSCSR
jgi:hypothetical protein